MYSGDFMEERLKDSVRPWTDEMRRYDKMRKLSISSVGISQKQ